MVKLIRPPAPPPPPQKKKNTHTLGNNRTGPETTVETGRCISIVLPFTCLPAWQNLNILNGLDNYFSGLQGGQGRPHHHWKILEALGAPKFRKLVADTLPLRQIMQVKCAVVKVTLHGLDTIIHPERYTVVWIVKQKHNLPDRPWPTFVIRSSNKTVVFFFKTENIIATQTTYPRGHPPYIHFP